MAWALAMTGQPTPAAFSPLLALDAMESRDTKPGVMYYQMLMQCAAVTGEVAAGFELLGRAQASGLLSQPDDDCYTMFRTLLEACCVSGDSDGASRVHAAVGRLGLIALVPVATASVHGSKRRYENGASGEGVTEARNLWLKVRQRTAYTAQTQALPWDFVRNSTLEQQQESLQLHAEKKALAFLLTNGESELDVSIEFNACADCHEFFKSTSLLFGRTIRLRQPRMVHTFLDGCCSCKDQWRWESRLVQMPP
eukprot:gnl/TRDRNA2_/TRDRNA2_173653_c10_seq7.p1 gnl/TRDRNA2_/TRDRNA2_173653_c10~~gnl/TRDRNA2_/TRDRNA2_173653_c10_seq7.p1  ORF type:complete len:253 (-),score=37.71 gnl/TRDRNA2_/TRDRNA2_173653_c10_seq7:94-852(-)